MVSERNSLTTKLRALFGEKVVLLTSLGFANMLVFKNYFHFALRSTDDDDDDDDKNLRFVAATIKAETSATDRNQYKVQFDADTVN